MSLASADGDEAGRTEEYWYDELTADGDEAGRPSLLAWS